MEKRKLKNALCDATGCRVQHTGWPCGTCFFALSKKLKNKDWQAVLYLRGDYTKTELNNLPQNIEETLEKVYQVAITS